MDAKQEGIEIGIEEMVVKAHKKGKSVEFIADLFDMPISKVRKIIARHDASK